jgi:hypothetical protein
MNYLYIKMLIHMHMRFELLNNKHQIVEILQLSSLKN